MILTNLHKLRELMPDPKTDSNVSKLLDDSTYAVLLEDQGVAPFFVYDPTDASTLKKIKKARIQAFYIIAGDEELIRSAQAEMSQQGEWDVYKHIRMLKFELSRLDIDIFGL